VEFYIKDNLKGMKLIHTLFFLLSALVVSAQNDTIYPAKTTYKVGEVVEIIFKSPKGSMQLLSDGACGAKLMYQAQTLKSTGWPQIYIPAQDACGLPYVEIPNGTKPFYTVNYTGTFRMVFFSDKGIIETDEYRVE
jgi:hypothetical protein